MSASSNNKDWYSVRCLFRIKTFKNTPKRNVYEERITIWRAESIDEAIELAEKEANEYVKDSKDEYLELAQGYNPLVSRLTSGTEIYSLIRDSNLGPEKYLDRFFDTGDERQTQYEGEPGAERKGGQAPPSA